MPAVTASTRRRAARLAALVLLAAGALPVPAARAEPRAALEFSDCRLRHPAGLGSVAARCASFEVAENRAEAAGQRIALRVALVPALDRRRTREPLFVVAGGPGQAASDYYAAYAGAFAPVLRTHDLVLVDQRGTGGSNRLGCRFPPDFDVATPSPAEIRALSARCRAGLPGRPAYYTTSVAVADLEAVRAALGAPRIALYGISYGTRVVEHYLRHHGEHAAAVVLDGVLPPDASPLADTPLAAERALGLAFARCRAAPECERAFPGLEARFAALRAELGRRPRHLVLADPGNGAPRTLDFDAAALAGTVRLLNYSAASTALLPYLLDRALHEDYAPLAAQLVMLGSHLDAQLAYGMNAAVTCSEDLPAAARADRAALATTYLGLQQLDGLAALCEGWPAGVVDADLYAPLVSRVPALLLSGEADPVTPPAYAERAAAGLADHRHVVVPGQGHGQLATGCAPQVIARFLDAGTARGLDVACLAKASAPPFVIDAAGPAP
ncbi:MAG: alpha/beta fold hydrolase [Proteobacteria bacterium]|nr:alpha/beta fold hydrolase [Pseudomonadota bacterium]